MTPGADQFLTPGLLLLFKFSLFRYRKNNDPLGGANFNPRAFIWTNFVDTHIYALAIWVF
jgi:hypothetical protein